MRTLVVAVSARMIAQLAVDDGYDVVALDRFGDVDLRAIAPGSTAASNEELTALAGDVEADAVVYGGGLENRPDLVARLGRGREILGVAPELLGAVRDPWEVAAAARAAGARAPQTCSPGEIPGTRGSGMWLRKPRLGGGGRGVRAWAGGRVRPTEIVQARVDGLSCSAVAIGNGRSATVLGVTEQLHRPSSFQWMGNTTPPRLPDGEQADLEGQLQSVCTEVAQRFGVRGAFGVDAVWDARHAWVLEVNPRPTGALELFGPGTFAAHVRGARGHDLRSTGSPPAARCARVKLVLFADRDIRAPEPGWWPADLVRDIPHAGETITRGAPVCTLISATQGISDISTLGAQLLARLDDAVLAGA
jgi:uncharacterized protein